MIDPILKRLADEPENFPPDQCFWFATAAGILYGKPISYKKGLELGAILGGESFGDYKNQVEVGKENLNLRPLSKEEHKQRPAFIFMMNALLMETGHLYNLPNTVLYISSVIAWGTGLPLPTPPASLEDDDIG